MPTGARTSPCAPGARQPATSTMPGAFSCIAGMTTAICTRVGAAVACAGPTLAPGSRMSQPTASPSSYRWRSASAAGSLSAHTSGTSSASGASGARRSIRASRARRSLMSPAMRPSGVRCPCVFEKRGPRWVLSRHGPPLREDEGIVVVPRTDGPARIVTYPTLANQRAREDPLRPVAILPIEGSREDAT